MRILGIDPGLANTGWAVLENKRYITSGVIKTPSKQVLPARLQYISSSLAATAARHHIQHVAMETLFGSHIRIHRTAELLGAIRLTLWQLGYMVENVSPTQAKKAVGAKGHAKKNEVARGVAKAIKTYKKMPHHETDACAIALAAVQSRA